MGLAMIASAPGTPAEKTYPLAHRRAWDGYRANGVPRRPGGGGQAARDRERALPAQLDRRARLRVDQRADRCGRRFAGRGGAAFPSVTSTTSTLHQDDLRMRPARCTGMLTPQAGAKGGIGRRARSRIRLRPRMRSRSRCPPGPASWRRPRSHPPARRRPADVTLANGLRLIVEQNSTISPTVTLSGSIRQNGDLQTPAGKEGVDDVTSRSLPVRHDDAGSARVPESAGRRGGRRERGQQLFGARTQRAVRSRARPAGRQPVAPGLPRHGVHDRADRRRRKGCKAN